MVDKFPLSISMLNTISVLRRIKHSLIRRSFRRKLRDKLIFGNDSLLNQELRKGVGLHKVRNEEFLNRH